MLNNVKKYHTIKLKTLSNQIQISSNPILNQFENNRTLIRN